MAAKTGLSRCASVSPLYLARQARGVWMIPQMIAILPKAAPIEAESV